MRTLTSAAFLLTLVALSCQSHQPQHSSSPDQEQAKDFSAYTTAASPEELNATLLQDLDAGQSDHAYRGLQKLLRQSMVQGEATYAHMLFERAHVLDFFLYDVEGGANGYINGVKEFRRVLKSTRRKELLGVYQNLRDGESDKVRHALESPRGCLNEEVVAFATGLLAHSNFFKGVLELEVLKASTSPTKADALPALAYFQKAAQVFASNHQVHEHFLCEYSIAQALGFVGAEEEAAEAWLATRATAHFSSVPKGVRDGIEQHIETYRQKLLSQVESSVAEAHISEKRDLVEHFEKRLAEASATQERLESEVLAKSAELQKLQQLGNINWEERPGLLDGLAKNMKVFFVRPGQSPAKQG